MLQNLKEEQQHTISNVKEQWEGDQGDFSFTVRGFDLAGNIKVNDSTVEINSDLPFAVSFFKGQISSLITKKAQELLKN